MHSFRAPFFTALLAASVAAATAAPIDPEGRVYLVQTDGQKAGATKPQRHDFHVEGKIDFKQTFFAAHLKGASPENMPEVFLNGVLVDNYPVARHDGLVVLLSWVDLKLGDNTLIVAPPSGGTIDVTGVDVFSLVGSAEEAHFERAFAENLDATKAAPSKHSSQDDFEPVHYDLTLTSTMADTSVTGSMRFTGRSKINGLLTVALDLANNSGAMVATTASVQQILPGDIPVSITATHASDRVVMTLDSALNVDDEFTVVIPYGGTPQTGGSFGDAFRRQTHSGTPIIYTFNEPYKARNWFPCVDLPEYKATFELKVTIPDTYKAVSNGTLLSEVDNGSTKTFHWSEGHPIPTYLIVLTATNYDYVEADYTALDTVTTMPVGIYHFPEQSAEATGLNETVNILTYFAETFGEYAYLDEKYVNSTHLSGSGMEHNTATSMPQNNVQLTSGINGDLTPGRHRRNVHEVSHHWFGNQVTCKTFNDVWLNEGIGTLAEALYYEHVYNDHQVYLDYVAGWDTTGISDTRIMVSSTSDDFASNLVYRKGGYVSHMLRGVVGDDDFFEALRLYLQTHAHGSVETSDLQDAFETVSGMDLDAFFDQWCYKMSRPSYSWGWNPTFVGADNAVSLSIEQTQSGTDIPNIFVMPIPIVVTDANSNSETFIVQNDQRTQSFVINTGELVPFSVEFDPNGWVLKYVTNDSAAATPTILSVIGGTTGPNATATVTWAHGSTGATPTGYQIIMTPEGEASFEAASVSGATTSHTVTGLDLNTTYRVYVRAVAVPGQPSDPSNIHGFRAGGEEEKVLIVEGYDRWFTQGREAYHDFAARHGDAIGAFGYDFDSVANEQVSSGAVLLGDYDAIVWTLGEESTAHDTFSTTEQGLVSTYMDNGGYLFTSGAEIGWDLHRTASSGSDKTFYNNYLKSSFVNADDSSGIWTGLYGTTGSIFDGLTGLAIDNGDSLSYFASFPDAVTTFGGSTAALQYSAGKIAGVQYEGTFGAGSATGKLVYLGFGFETITGAANREAMMDEVLGFFFGFPHPSEPSSVRDAFLLH